MVVCHDHLGKTKKTYLSEVHLEVYKCTEKYLEGWEGLRFRGSAQKVLDEVCDQTDHWLWKSSS